MNRRTLLKGLIATAAGVLIPGDVLAEPERRIWALNQTMIATPEPMMLSWNDLPEVMGSMFQVKVYGSDGELIHQSPMTRLSDDFHVYEYDVGVPFMLNAQRWT